MKNWRIQNSTPVTPVVMHVAGAESTFSLNYDKSAIAQSTEYSVYEDTPAVSFRAEVSESGGAFIRPLGPTADGRSASGDWRSFGRDNGFSESTCWRVCPPATIDALVSVVNLHR